MAKHSIYVLYGISMCFCIKSYINIYVETDPVENTSSTNIAFMCSLLSQNAQFTVGLEIKKRKETETGSYGYLTF